jgi:hypothetical protein
VGFALRCKALARQIAAALVLNRLLSLFFRITELAL